LLSLAVSRKSCGAGAAAPAGAGGRSGQKTGKRPDATSGRRGSTEDEPSGTAAVGQVERARAIGSRAEAMTAAKVEVEVEVEVDVPRTT
jgi:hypothetical protein